MPSLDRTAPDRTLIRESLAGNGEAVRLLVERHQPSLLHYARGLAYTEQEAQQAVLRTLRRGFRQLSRLRRNSLPSSFFIGLLRKELARMKRPCAGPRATPVWTALAGLPRVQREVVFLFFQGLRLPEIAAIRHEPLSHSRSRLGNALHRVIRRLRGEEAAAAVQQRPSLPAAPSCMENVLLTLFLTDCLGESEAGHVKGHLAACESCRRRAEEAGEVFNKIKAEVAGAASVPPLLREAPAPGLWPTVLAVAGAAAVGIAVFFLLRGPLSERLKPVPSRGSPQAQEQVTGGK